MNTLQLELPRLNWRVMFEAKEKLNNDDEKAMDEYFSRFLTPTGRCYHCGHKLACGSITDFLTGKGSFRWGLVHGEGFCSHCKYPARAYHRDVGPITFLNLILQYHPNEFKREARRRPHEVRGSAASNACFGAL